MNADELRPYLNDANVRSYLGAIAQGEGTAKAADPYRVAFGGKQIDSLDAHPGIHQTFRQTDGKMNTTSAAGAYQFQKGTWDDVSKELGLTDFGPQSQDLGALLLMARNGSLKDVVNGDFHSAVAKDGKTWASMPTSTAAQPKKSEGEWMAGLGQRSPQQSPLAPGSNPFSPSPTGAAGAGTASTIGTVPTANLLDMLGRAQAANDDQATHEISTELQPRLESGLAKAQAANDNEAVTQYKGFLGRLGAKQAVAQAAPGSQQQQGTFIGNVGRQIDNAVRGAADTLSFGYADELAAKMGELTGLGRGATGGDYESNLASQRQIDKEGGLARTAGQVAGALVPLPFASAAGATRAAEGASILSRVGRGAVGGAIQGGLYGTGSAEGDIEDRLKEGAWGALGGAALGGALPAVMPLTMAQKEARYIKKAGGEEAARRDAEITLDLKGLAERETQGGVPLGAKAANAAGNVYLKDAAGNLNAIGRGETADLRQAIGSAGGLNDERLAALAQSSPHGEAVVQAIKKQQRMEAMTAAKASIGGPVGFLRRAALDFVPMPYPLRLALQPLLGGRQTREMQIQRLLKQSGVAQAVLDRLGASKASTTAADLAAAAQAAQGARAASAAVGKAARRGPKDVMQTPLGKTITKAQNEYEAGQNVAHEANLTPGIDPSNIVAAATQAPVGKESALSKLVTKANTQFDKDAGDVSALRMAPDVGSLADQAHTSVPMKSEGGLMGLIGKAQDTANGLEASGMDGATALRNEISNIKAEGKAGKVTQATEAKAERAAQTQASVDRVANGDFTGLSLKNGPISGWLEHTNAAPEAVHQTLSGLAAADPDGIGKTIVKALTPGGKLTRNEYYTVQNALHAVHGQRDVEGALAAATAEADGAKKIWNPVAYKAQVDRRVAMADHAAANAPSTAIAQGIHDIAHTKEQSGKADLLAKLLAKHPKHGDWLAEHAAPLAAFGE